MPIQNIEQANAFVEKYCDQNLIHNSNVPDSKGHFFTKGLFHLARYWSWYGAISAKKFRMDFCIDANAFDRDKVYSAVRKILGGEYDVSVPKTTFHIFFIRDVPFGELSDEMLENALSRYQKFIQDKWPKIKEILESRAV